MSSRKGSDLNAREFVNYFLRTRPGLRPTLAIPFDQALNESVDLVFTQDQLAWMRIEQQTGYKYATMDKDGQVFFFFSKPHKDGDVWTVNTDNESYSERRDGFIEDVLSWEDDEPFCFAHYTGVEGSPVL